MNLTITPNASENMYLDEDLSFGYALHKMLSYLLFFLAKSSDAMLIYVYFKYPMVRTWENYLVLHWALTSFSIFLLTFIIDYVIIRTILDVRQPNCYGAAAYRTLVILSLWLADAILLSYVLLHSKYELPHKWVVVFKRYFAHVLYVSGFCIYIYEIYVCEDNNGAQDIVFFEILELLALSLNVLVLIIVPLGEKSQNAKYTLYVANVIFFSFMPMVMFHYLIVHFLDNSTVIEFLLHAHSVPRLVLICNSIGVCVVLYRCDKYYGTAMVLTARKCSCVSNERVGWNDLTEHLATCE